MSLYAKSSFSILKNIRKSLRFTSFHSSQRLNLHQKSCTQSYSITCNSTNSSIKPNQFFRQFHTSYPFFKSVTVKCPPFAESISEGDVRWEKAVGDAVVEDDTVAEVETDKTSIPIPSPSSGVVEELLVEDGTTVTPGTSLFKIKTDGIASTPSESKETVKETESAKPPPKEEVPATPKPTTIPSSAPPPSPLPTKPLSSVTVSDVSPLDITSSTPAASSSRSEHRVKMNRMRLRIAQRLKDSQNTAAMLTTFNEIDMSSIMAMRNKYKDAFLKKHGLKLSFMSAFIKASAYALEVSYCFILLVFYSYTLQLYYILLNCITNIIIISVLIFQLDLNLISHILTIGWHEWCALQMNLSKKVKINFGSYPICNLVHLSFCQHTKALL